MILINTAPTPASRLYCPILFKFAARLEQMTWPDFTADPIEMVAALRNAQRASGADLIVNWFDTFAECETLGAEVVRDSDGNAASCATPPHGTTGALTVLRSELLPRLKEVAARLHADRGPGTLLGGFLTGPNTLAKRISGTSSIASPRDGGSAAERSEAAQFAVQWAIEVIRGYGEIGLDLSIIAEDEPGAAAFFNDHAKAVQPLVNLSRYYRHPLIVLNRRPLDDETANAGIGGAPQIGTIRMIPEELFRSPAQTTAGQLKTIPGGTVGGRMLMLSSWEVPVEAEPERLRELGVRLKSGDL
ncbi:MAG TPA: uroporphyrinogen decarboxylase family protein [Candidatus Binataceae bacterium]|nr:uroporphyrinogen decarboxylase family protein [Candidatus Binataceae bacterium]